MKNVRNDNSREYGAYIFIFPQALTIFLKTIQVFVNVERIDDNQVRCMVTVPANLLLDSYNLDRDASGRRRRRKRRGSATTAFFGASQST
jgi:hypothetical protein